MSARFVLLADTHYHPSAPKDFGPPKLLTKGPQILAATIPAVEALQADFVVHVGDLLCGGGSFELPAPEYDRSLQDVGQAYGQLTAPFYCVPGNHDCDSQEYRYARFIDAFATPQTLDVVDVAPGLRLVRAHIFADGEADAGNWTDALDEALRATDATAQADGAVLFLVLHSWFHPGAGDDPDKGIIANASRLRQTMTECGSIAATFAGHRHANRVRLFHDYVCIDTACLIGYPLGFREITVADDGWLTSRWHTLDLPDILQESAATGTRADQDHWAGEFGDRDTTILLPRAREIWSK